MKVDRELLARHSSFTDEGIEERAVHFDIGGESCFGLLYQPADPRGLGFVVCHSYALEFLTLRRIERSIARALASMGYPVLAFHSRGFGDSTGTLAEATFDRLQEDLFAGASWMMSETGASDLGFIGARFGALRAGVAARGGDAGRVVLVAPEFSGTTYFRRLIRNKHMVELVDSGGSARRSMDELLDVLAKDGMLDLLGYALHGHLYKAFAGINLSTDVGSFSGDALLVQVSKRTSPSSEALAYSKRVVDGGGRCRLEVIKEPPGVNIGGPAFVSTSDPFVREDLQEPVVDRIAELVKEWIKD